MQIKHRRGVSRRGQPPPRVQGLVSWHRYLDILHPHRQAAVPMRRPRLNAEHEIAFLIGEKGKSGGRQRTHDAREHERVEPAPPGTVCKLHKHALSLVLKTSSVL